MFKYYNANPLHRNVNDCSIRAISLATGQTWDRTYIELAEFARREGITFSEVEFINDYLEDRYKIYCPSCKIYTLQDFLDLELKGNWLVTMRGHITCVIDGTVYDTFDCRDRPIWNIYKVK